MKKGRSSGFTLIELMIVVALLAIVAVIAVPSLTSFIRNNQVQAKGEETYRLLQFARGEATTKRVRVEVRFASDEVSVWMRNPISGSYENVRSMDVDADKVALRRTALTDNKLIYNVNGSATPATLTFCYGTDASTGYTIQVQRSGLNQLFPKGKSGASGSSMSSCTP